VTDLVLKSPALVGIHHKVYAEAMLLQVETICTFVAKDARARQESVHKAAMSNIDAFERFMNESGRIHSRFSGATTLNGNAPTRISMPIVPLPGPGISSGVHRYRYREQHMRSVAIGGFGPLNALGKHEIYMREDMNPEDAWTVIHRGVGYELPQE
jgi:hypothetical protein